MLITEQTRLEEIPGLVIRELRRAIVDNRHPFRFFWLGSTDGRSVRVRTVVLRDWDAGSQPWIFADGRSEKVEHFRLIPSASLLFFHPRKQLQIRFDAIPEIHQGTERAEALWPRVQGEARNLYGSVLPPGMEVNHPEEGWELKEPVDIAHFCPISFRVQDMEVLQLNQMKHLRAHFRPEDGEWRGSWLVP